MDIFWEKGQYTPHIVDSENSNKHVHASDGCAESWERSSLLMLITMLRIWSKDIALQEHTRLPQNLDEFESLWPIFL